MTNISTVLDLFEHHPLTSFLLNLKQCFEECTPPPSTGKNPLETGTSSIDWAQLNMHCM
jgi:hypothetical protein